MQEQINKMEKKIEKAESEIWNEQQPKNNLHCTPAYRLIKKLEELKGGQNTPHCGAN